MNKKNLPTPAATIAIMGISFIAMLLLSVVPIPNIFTAQWLIVVEVVTFGLPAAFFVMRSDDKMTRRIATREVQPYVNAFFAAVAGVVFMNNIMALWASSLTSYGFDLSYLQDDSLSTTLTLFSQILAIGLVPAVCEELFFRSFVLSAFEPLGTAGAITLTSLFFGLMHGSVVTLPTHIMLGFSLTFIAYSTGSVLPSIVYHATHNLVLIWLNHIADTTDMPATFVLSSVEIPSIIIQSALFLMLWLLFIKNVTRVESATPKRELARARQGAAFYVSLTLVLLLFALQIALTFYI